MCDCSHQSNKARIQHFIRLLLDVLMPCFYTFPFLCLQLTSDELNSCHGKTARKCFERPRSLPAGDRALASALVSSRLPGMPFFRSLPAGDQTLSGRRQVAARWFMPVEAAVELDGSHQEAGGRRWRGPATLRRLSQICAVWASCIWVERALACAPYRRRQCVARSSSPGPGLGVRRQ